ncbi:DUF5082 family protein [Bacillus vallismortis]|uniref:DUF5082 domain-containing protein n=1 Tax=Bacillus vallismortis TaxID=72361 RepID=A0AAP3FYT6_BACVA|nr:DUF5082 family protein [Bacillus vallismortis]MCY8307809.1 DUF5082 domain-containing protein [Bacillus vallismortis]MCY8318199.1 DUF5082 domain-containing protein [Bacillus vallismortis]MCY8534179.1 DUF5082 domain-containing protein [Bacillus vallismortis]MCY8545600.1 DUF5082 domain-containing protein [Bacillus vallismortis]MCY8595657.1 DUF5082 domain-containing protein [Bacillus vallismortis]
MHSEMLLHSVKADLYDKQEQIHQLKRVLHEIRQIKHDFSEVQHFIHQPYLDRNAWRGKHAERFEDIRDGMNKTYDQIKSQQVSGIMKSIEGKINSLEEDVYSIRRQITKIEHEIKIEKHRK